MDCGLWRTPKMAILGIHESLHSLNKAIKRPQTLV